MIIQYEHIDPAFKDALTHDPSKITLLCGGCHDKVTRKVWSKEKVAKANDNPLSRLRGYASEQIDIGASHPVISIGNNRILNSFFLVSMSESLDHNPIPLLTINPPDSLDDIYTIDLFITNNQGNEVLRIVRNEVKLHNHQWDARIEGGVMTIMSAETDSKLVIRLNPPNEIIFEHLDMLFGQGRVVAIEGKLHFLSTRVHVSLNGLKFENLSHCFSFFATGRTYVLGIGVWDESFGRTNDEPKSDSWKPKPYGWIRSIGKPHGVIERYHLKTSDYGLLSTDEISKKEPAVTIIVDEDNGVYSPVIVPPS